MKRFSISNWPFAMKFAVPSAVSLLLIGLLAFLSYLSLQEQVTRTDKIVNRDLASAITLSEANSRIQGVNGRLYQLLTMQAAAITGGENPAQAVGALGADVDKVLADLGAYRGTLTSQEDSDAVLAIETDLKKYKEAIEVVASMMEIDFAAAVSFAQPFAENYNSLLEAFDALVARTVETSRASAAAGAKAASAANTIQIAAALFALAASGLLAFLVGMATVRSIRQISSATGLLAAGDLSADIEKLKRADELSGIVDSLVIFKDNTLEFRRVTDAQKTAEQRVAEQRKIEMRALADNFESAVGAIIRTVSSAATELETAADTLTSTADSTQQLSTTVASASGRASANVQSVAVATEEMSSSIAEISRQVQHSAQISTNAVQQAQETTNQVNELAGAAERIGDVVELISSIAGQTNLLALNATIEAARAGDAGRGFAVVASEVKMLAEQTAKATGEISEQIKDIQRATSASVDSIRLISETILRMSEIGAAITRAVEEQGEATQEISRNVQQAAESTAHVASNITDVQQGSMKTGSASSQVLESARSLSEESTRLNTEVGKFLRTVRAA